MTDTVQETFTAEQVEALDIARGLAAAGVPLFVAPPAPNKVGFALPVEWEQTTPDPAVVDTWRPGMALCAVMGRGLDLIDIDPRNGGGPAVMNGSTPHSYGIQLTPSGGMHSFIASTGAGSRDNVWPGIDVKSGMADGTGRGFAFLAPTVKVSKVTGEPTAYRWAQAPDVARLSAVRSGAAIDTSGEALAARIRELKADSGVRKVGGPDWYQEFLRSDEPQSAPAAERAIAEKLAEVSGWTTESGGGFRQALMRAAMTLGGYVGGGYLDADEARTKLVAAVEEVWGSPDEDDERWIEQGLTDGQGSPFFVYTAADELAYSDVAQSAGRTPGDGEPPWTVYTAIGTEAFDPAGDSSDQGLAEAVMARMYPALRYGADSGSWLVRGRYCWRDRDDMSGWAISTLARLMPLGATPVPKDATDRTEAHWQALRRARFMDSTGAGKIERKLRSIVRNTDHPGAVEVSGLDADPEILWAGGLAWDLRASAEEPAVADIDPATPHLHTALCAPAPRDTPNWDRFVAAVWPDDDVRAWALRVLSLSLAGYPDAALPVLFGPERTGKTALVSLVVKVLGSYGHAADPRLLAGADNTHASVVHALKGRRLSFIDEGPRRGHLAAERLKQLTGGGELTGNAMRANPITFTPTHTLVMTTNDEPQLTDPALRARVRLIPCEGDQATVRAARQALSPAVWHHEAPGVLAALMRETAAWLADPDSATTGRAPLLLQDTVEEMAAGQDPVREWVENCCVPAEPGTQAKALYELFAAWHDGQARYRRTSPPSMTAWGRSLTDLGYPAAKVHGLRYRPLSVMSGPGTAAPWEPANGSTAALPTSPAGTVAGRVQEGCGTELSPRENTSSVPVSSSLGDSGEGYPCSTEEEINTPPKSSTPLTKNGEKGEATLHPPRPTERNSASPARTVVGGQSDETVQAPAPSPNPGLAPTTTTPVQPTLDITTQSEIQSEDAKRAAAHSVTRQVALLAEAEGITKTEARARLKAQARVEAIHAAQGEVLSLPAVVDRDGNTLALTEAQAADVVRTAIARSGALTVDVETSGYPVGHADYALRSVQLGDATAAVVWHPVTHAEPIRALMAEAPRLHAHSATADLVPLAHAGLLDIESAWDRMHDTVIPAKLADPASTGSDPGLKQLAGAVLGPQSVAPAADAGREALFKAGKWLTNTKVDTPVERSGWAQVTTESAVMLRYAASDVLDTAGLAQQLPVPAPAVLERERVAQRMTARVTHRGLRIDADHVNALTETHTAARAAAGTTVRAAGIDNPGSDQQVGRALLALGATLPISEKGNPSVAEAVLRELIGATADARVRELTEAVLEFRHHDTVLGTFLGPYRQLCERGDGRARPTVYTLGTNTGRMSCVRPNLQQLPREGGVRACITADPGQVLISADFSGVEIRVAAALSGDQVLRQILEDGRDLHGEIARQVWGPEAGKADRYVAKRAVFGRIYGGGIATLAAQLGVSQTVIASVIDTLDEMTPGLAGWSAAVRDAVKAGRTQYPTYSGRTIHLPAAYPHKAPNYCIQGSARELLVDALLRWRDTRWGDATLIPVHDELVIAVPEQDADEATSALVTAMETELNGIRIVAEPSAPSFAWRDST